MKGYWGAVSINYLEIANWVRGLAPSTGASNDAIWDMLFNGLSDIGK
jgi:hypothetical protein